MNFDQQRFLDLLRDAVEQENQKASMIFVAPKNSRAYECCVDNCFRPAYANNYCNAHYMRARKGLDLAAPVRARKREDLCEECGEKTGARGGWGLCSKHYNKKRSTIIKDALIEAMGGGCAKCGGVFHRAVYDFHHESEKTNSPSFLIRNRSLEQIAEELSGCILLCANCHRMEHNDGF